MENLTKKSGIAGTVNTYLSGNNLKAKCVRGVTILGAGTAVDRGVKFVVQMILTRLLVPEEFMVWGIIHAIIAICEAVAEVGVRQSIVRSERGATPEFMNVAWWFQVFRGVTLYALAMALSPVISGFYFTSKPAILELYPRQELLLLLNIAFTSILCNALTSPGVFVLRKEFRFGKLLFFQQGSALLGTLVTILIAFFVVNNAWAIVLGYLVENVFRCVISFVICPFLPRFKLDRDCFKELLEFVRGVVGMPILTVIVTQIDDFFLGRMILPGVYGMYTRAKVLSNMPQQLFAQVINPVLLPAFSEKKNDIHGTRKGLLIMTAATCVLYLPMLVFIALNARFLLSVVWGPDYGMLALSFIWLFGLVVVRTQSFYLVSMTMALGKPHLVRIFLIIRVVLAAATIYPAIKLYGVSGAAMILTVSSLIALIAQVVLIMRDIQMKFTAYLRAWGLGFLYAAVLLIIGGGLRQPMSDYPLYYCLLTGLLTGLTCLMGLWRTKRNGFSSRAA